LLLFVKLKPKQTNSLSPTLQFYFAWYLSLPSSICDLLVSSWGGGGVAAIRVTSSGSLFVSPSLPKLTPWRRKISLTKTWCSENWKRNRITRLFFIDFVMDLIQIWKFYCYYIGSGIYDFVCLLLDVFWL
jgi:hypothetical protein